VLSRRRHYRISGSSRSHAYVHRLNSRFSMNNAFLKLEYKQHDELTLNNKPKLYF